MDLDQLLNHFQKPRPAQRFAGSLQSLGEFRGDHNLNPGMQPRLPKAQGLSAAAVLVPIINRPRELTVLLTQRTDHLTHHPGQISFPGGRVEPQDGGILGTALRETQEEIGLAPEQVRALGVLDDYVTRTGFVVTPVVGLIEPPVHFQPDPFEVAQVFEVPLSFLLDVSNARRHSHHFEGKERFFYAIPYGEYFIWGATAGMLVNLQERLGTVPLLEEASHGSGEQGR